MKPKVLKLYQVPKDGQRVPCRECGMPMVFVPGVKPGSKVLLSIDHPQAMRDITGAAVMAPSHYTDCTKPARFSRAKPAKKD